MRNFVLYLGKASVAQLVEQRFRKPQVDGSNPFAGSVEFYKLEWTRQSLSSFVWLFLNHGVGTIQGER